MYTSVLMCKYDVLSNVAIISMMQSSAIGPPRFAVFCSQMTAKDGADPLKSEVNDLDFREFCFEIFRQESTVTHFRRRFRTEENTPLQVFRLHALTDVSCFDQFVEFLDISIPRDHLVSVPSQEPPLRSPISLVLIFDSDQVQQKRKIPLVGVKAVSVRIFQANVDHLHDIVLNQNVKKFFRWFLSVADGKKPHIHDPFLVRNGPMPPRCNQTIFCFGNSRLFPVFETKETCFSRKRSKKAKSKRARSCVFCTIARVKNIQKKEDKLQQFIFF